MCVLRERLSNCVCTSLPFGIGGGMWNVTVLIPAHFLSIYLEIFGFLTEKDNKDFVSFKSFKRRKM